MALMNGGQNQKGAFQVKRNKQMKRSKKRERKQNVVKVKKVKTLREIVLEIREKRIAKRLRRRTWKNQPEPMLQASNVHYEMDGRRQGIAQGGIGALHVLVKRVGLVKDIDDNIHLLKRHVPYHESDHVLNLAYNIIAGGTHIEDIELRRQDEAWLNALGADIIPAPTTAGDFLHRFQDEDIVDLMDTINGTRQNIWDKQPKEFFEKATINVDGTMAETTGECKGGMDISYKGIWGYSPLIVSLSETREPLYIVNRPGNAPSHLGSAQWIDRSLDLVCGRFEQVWLRGDTDFSLTGNFDRWAERCTFVLGMDAKKNLSLIATGLDESCWQPIERKPKYEVKTDKRQRPENVKERIVKERGFENIRTTSEQVAEFEYRPGKCERTYRVVVLRKNLTIEKGELALFDDIRYFFYITNDRTMTTQEVVYFANERCDHENDIEQLKNGVHAIRIPSDDLTSNWAYMVIAALAWSIKAWYGLLTPNRELSHKIVRMEFKRFLNTFVNIACYIVKSGRRIVYRAIGYNEHLKDFFRTFEALKVLRFT